MIKFIGGWDDYLKSYRYKVLDDAGRTTYWNEISMRKVGSGKPGSPIKRTKERAKDEYEKTKGGEYGAVLVLAVNKREMLK